MKNQKIILMFAISIILLISLTSLTSAYTFSEKWKYKEDLSGRHRGFTLKHTITTQPSYQNDYYAYRPTYNGAYFDHRYNPRIHSYASYPPSYYNSYSPQLSQKALNQAFNTYQQSNNRYRYSYGNHYSGYRYRY